MTTEPSPDSSDLLGNLREITMSDNRSIRYVYAADGTRLRTTHKRKVGNTYLRDSTEYFGNLIVKNGQPVMYRFSGGYFAFDNGALSDCHYYIQDYLGSNRMVVSKGGSVKQSNHYYPYGGIIGGIDFNPTLQPYKFEDKELDRTYGLDWYDIHARQYDPVVPSWHTIDPLAEKYYYISPYAYCANNPVNYMDTDGKKIYIPKNYQSKILAMINSFSSTQYRVDEKGFMCVDDAIENNINGSVHYSERLDATISAEGLLTIMLGDKYTVKDAKTSKIYDVTKTGGGLTDKTNKTNVKTVVSEKGHLVHDTEGNEVKKTAEEVLIHEIVGHAAPALVGTETGNAVKNENIVRKELKLPEREDEDEHNE